MKKLDKKNIILLIGVFYLLEMLCFFIGNPYLFGLVVVLELICIGIIVWKVVENRRNTEKKETKNVTGPIVQTTYSNKSNGLFINHEKERLKELLEKQRAMDMRYEKGKQIMHIDGEDYVLVPELEELEAIELIELNYLLEKYGDIESQYEKQDQDSIEEIRLQELYEEEEILRQEKYEEEERLIREADDEYFLYGPGNANYSHVTHQVESADYFRDHPDE